MTRSRSAAEHLQLLRWRSRRGLLELELLLLPFAADRLQHLGAEQLQAYEQLLSCEDLDIYDWLQQRSAPLDESLLEIIKAVRDHKSSLGR